MLIKSIPSLIHEGQSYWQVLSSTDEQLVLKVLDAQGKIAKTVVQQVSEGFHQLSVNLSDLGAGKYVVNAFSNGNFLKAVKLLVQ